MLAPTLGCKPGRLSGQGLEKVMQLNVNVRFHCIQQLLPHAAQGRQRRHPRE